MARKSSKSKRRTLRQITAKDFRYPGESNVYWMAMAGIMILFVWIVGMLLIFAKQKNDLSQPLWLLVLLYPILAFYVAGVLSAQAKRVQLKRGGKQARVMPGTRPELHKRLSRMADLLGCKGTPELYILTDQVSYVYSIHGGNGTIVTSTAVENTLSDDEFSAVIAREVAAISAHNVRTALMTVWIQSANIILRILCFPVALLALMMRGWQDLAEFTADRGALLAVGSEATLNLAMLKLVIARDPNADVNQEDLEAYLRGPGAMSADGAQLERHFRIGRFISEQPNLKERVEQLGEYRKSDQGTVAFEKLSEAQKTMPLN